MSASTYDRAVYCEMRNKELKAGPHDDVDSFKKDFEEAFEMGLSYSGVKLLLKNRQKQILYLGNKKIKPK